MNPTKVRKSIEARRFRVGAVLLGALVTAVTFGNVAPEVGDLAISAGAVAFGLSVTSTSRS